MTSKYDPLKCPLPGCGHDLHIIWSTSRALVVDDINVPPTVDDSDVGTWKVECEDGHVVLVPAHINCAKCDDEGCDPLGCDTDSSDDYRTFRRTDAGRLAEMIAAVTR